MIEYGIIFVLWILILYTVPFVYARFLDRSDIDFLGPMILLILTALVFPAFFFLTSKNSLLTYLTSGTNIYSFFFIMTPPTIILFFWNFFITDRYFRDKFILSLVAIYLPAIAAMFLLLLIDVFEFSVILILPFIVPVAAYYFFKQLGYVTSCAFLIIYLIFDMQSALIVSAISAAGVIVYKSRFRRVKDAGEISIGETINSGMPVLAYTGFSAVKDYSEIPDEAIDPYTQHRIHELITQGKKIVKCNACGTYYDREILNFYQNSCAVFGCANSKF